MMSRVTKKAPVVFIQCDLCNKVMYRADEPMSAEDDRHLYYHSGKKDAHKICIDKLLAKENNL